MRRAGHTYRTDRRNRCREGGVLRFWRLSPYRVWLKGKRQLEKGWWPWVVLVRPMPPIKKVTA